MPILGASTGQVSKRGLIIPAGWGQNWRAARANHATQLVEAVIFGDSTWWGQSSSGGSNNYSTNNYSPVAEIRKQSKLAGYTDGGPGALTIYDSGPQQLTTNNVDPIVQGGTFALGSAAAYNNIMGGYGMTLSGTGQSGTVQGWYTRLRIYYSQDVVGSFTYSVNGGAATTVTVSSTSTTWGSVYITMPAGQLNQVVVTWVSGTCYLDFDMFNSVGLCFHRHCVPGAQIPLAIPTQDDSGGNQILGVSLGALQNTGISSGMQKVTTGLGTQWRNPSLVGMTLGINDINAVVAGAAASAPKYNVENFEEGINNVAVLARTVGADMFFVIPHWKVTQTNYGKAGAQMTKAIISCALSQGAAVIDTNEALGGSVQLWNTADFASQNPHLNSSGYVKIGQYVWSNLLGV